MAYRRQISSWVISPRSSANSTAHLRPAVQRTFPGAGRITRCLIVEGSSINSPIFETGIERASHSQREARSASSRGCRIGHSGAGAIVCTNTVPEAPATQGPTVATYLPVRGILKSTSPGGSPLACNALFAVKPPGPSTRNFQGLEVAAIQ
jgi:hypothetical protein